MTGCSASPSPERRRAGAAAVACRSGRGGNGRRPDFEVDSDHAVPAGIDGEAVKLDPPLRFRIRPGVLRVRIARAASRRLTLGDLPEGFGQSARALARIAPGAIPCPNPTPTTHEGELMDIFEVEQKERLSREEVAARLRNLADMLARHNDIEFERGGMRFNVHVPDEVNLKLELELETDECEFEIELTW